MSDRYVHHNLLGGGWDHRHDNLVLLGRHLVLNAQAIGAGGGLGFDESMGALASPQSVAAGNGGGLPPLTHGPRAGLSPQSDEDWAGYCRRVFGIGNERGLLTWLQSPLWRKTDPSPEGAALRIAYLLDYGLPHDHVEIAMGQAYSDYDSSGFLWEKLNLSPPAYADGDNPVGRSKRPAWIGAVELNRRRAEARKGSYLLPPDEAPFSAGVPPERLRALEARFGPMPATYHDFLLLSGRRVGGGDSGAYADGLEAIDGLARERIFAGERKDDDPVPQDAIFIGLADGRHPEFILAGKRSDSAVFRFDADDGRVTEVAISVFPWIEAFMKSANAPPPAAVNAPAGNERSLFGMIRKLFR